LAQTLTINCCRESKLTPFSYINTYLHIQDTDGKESLFQTEIRRCKEHIDEVKDNRGMCLTVFDEIFSSTNHVEGYAGAKAFCKAIGKIKNSVSIITTHYTKLGSLKKNNFSNLHFEAEENDDGITFDYKVKKGVSNQYVALKLMKHKGFDNELIEDAIKITKAFNKGKKSVR
jgi:DNA mismatch repair ATPase MutS